MKKNAIVRLVIYGIAAVLLCGLLVCGIVFGSNMNFFGLNIGSVYDESECKVLTNGKADINMHDINEIYIDWTAGKVDVKTDPSADKISFNESSVQSINDDAALRYSVKDNKLSIHFRKSGFLFNLFGNNKSKTLEMTIPASYAEKLDLNTVSAALNINNIKVNKCEIDTVSGDVTLSSITAKTLDIDTTSGKVTADNSVADDFIYDGTSGDVNFSGTISNKIDVNTVSGSAKIDTDKTPANVDSDSVSGNFLMTIPADSEFTAELSAVSGKLNTDFSAQLSDSKYIVGSGQNNYDFNSVSGDVSISKK